MAKPKDVEGNDDKSDRMDEESLGFLDQVRKGKSRNFVMSAKGAKVRSLLVKKKKVKDKDKKEARGQGFQPVFGVVSGMGAKITFALARSDGFGDVPGGGKVGKLKKFLKEQTDKPFKPEWEVVDTPPPIPSDRKAELHGTITQIAGEIKAKQFDQAKQRITGFATLLKSLMAQQPETSPSEFVDRMQEFTERRNAMQSQLLDAQKADREKATKLGAVWDYAYNQAQTGNFENAFKALDEIEQKLAS